MMSLLVVLLWLPCIADAEIIFLPCVFFYLSFFLTLSQPSQIDVCRTCTHGVALVQIWDAGLKHAARGSLKI